MNVYGVVILATLLVSYVLDLVANLLNLRALRPDLPGEFEGVYDAAEYARSQEYTRVRTRFGLVTATVGLAITLAFWFSGGFNLLDQVVRAWGLGTVASGVLYMGILVLARALLGLPFSLYATFVIEERFGFNKTTPRTFVLDRVKGLGLTVLLGGPVLAVVLWFFEFAGAMAWLYCWAAATLFTLLFQYVLPTWIMPIFNKFEPLEQGDLREAIFDYARSVGFRLSEIFVVDGSRRSKKSNAFFTGFGRNKRIALFDTLIEKHSIPELVAVLGHEVGHYKRKHILKGMLIGIAHMGVVFFLLSIFLGHRGLFDAFYMEEPSVYAGLIFFGMLYAPIELILSVLLNLLSRRHEYEADRFAVETTENPDVLIKALRKLSVDNLTNLTPHPVFVFLEYSHPPILERIRAISGPCEA